MILEFFLLVVVKRIKPEMRKNLPPPPLPESKIGIATVCVNDEKKILLLARFDDDIRQTR